MGRFDNCVNHDTPGQPCWGGMEVVDDYFDPETEGEGRSTACSGHYEYASWLFRYEGKTDRPTPPPAYIPPPDARDVEAALEREAAAYEMPAGAMSDNQRDVYAHRIRLFTAQFPTPEARLAEMRARAQVIAAGLHRWW